MKAHAFTILAPISRADATEGGQTPVDVGPTYTRNGLIVATTLNTAGTTPTCAIKIQNSAPLAINHSIISTESSTLADIGHRLGAADNLRIAAKFAVGAAGATVKKVVIPLKKVGAPTGTFTLAIYADSAGSPTGSALATFATLDVATLTTSYQDIEFALTATYDLAEGTYHLVATSDVSASASVYVAWRSITVASGGNLNLYDSAYAIVGTSNMEYRLHSYTFADVTGATFTTATTTATVQAIEVRFTNLAVIRPFITITGTDTPAYTVAITGVAETAQA
jgi:hypothetical protein